MKSLIANQHEVALLQRVERALIVRAVKIAKGHETDLISPSCEKGLFYYHDAEKTFIKPYFKSPFGSPGDELVCKETWATGYTYAGEFACVFYKSDNGCRLLKGDSTVDAGQFASRPPDNIKWRSPATMPLWASRLTLVVKEVRVKRVNELTGQEILSMGHNSLVHPDADYFNASQRDCFERYWQSHNKKYPFESNPFVWLAEVERKS
jgi:hypothetical protein